MDNTVSVASQDSKLKYTIVITQNGPDSAQFNVTEYSLDGNETVSSSSHVLANLQITGDVVHGTVKVIFYPAPVAVTVNVRDVTVQALGETQVYPLSALDRVAVLHFLASSGFPETGVLA